MYDLKTQVEFSNKARDALQRIQERKNEKSASDLLLETKLDYDYSRQVFEEFTDSKFVKKIEVDKYIYESFLKNVENEEVLNQVNTQLGEMLDTIKSIYEHINIEPKIYGFKTLTAQSSEDELISESRRIIFEHLDRNYYLLTTPERDRKYKDYVIGRSYDITINENIEVDESVTHAYKAAIINSLLENINFPFTIKCKIEELLESQIYKEVFDADTLEALWESFQEQSFNLSRIFSMTC